MPKLYEICNEMRAISDAIADGDDVPADLEARLDAVNLDLANKVEAICKVRAELRRDADKFNAESDRLGAIARRLSSSADRLRDYLAAQLRSVGARKLDAGLFRVRFQKNSSPTIRFHGNLDDLPADMVETWREFNIKAAAQIVKAGGELPAGVVVERGEHLRID